MMGIIEPKVPPIPFWMATIVSPVVNPLAKPKPQETSKKDINGCSLSTEMNSTNKTMATQMNTQILIIFRLNP